MKRSIRPQSRRHIWFYDEDWDFVSKFLSPKAQISPGAYCREVIHKLVMAKREAQQLEIERVHREDEANGTT